MVEDGVRFVSGHQNASGVPGVTELAIKGDEATLKRVSGIRYLKAD